MNSARRKTRDYHAKQAGVLDFETLFMAPSAINLWIYLVNGWSLLGFAYGFMTLFFLFSLCLFSEGSVVVHTCLRRLQYQALERHDRLEHDTV